MRRILDKIARRFGYSRTQQRAFAFAQQNRLTNDWLRTDNDADKELRPDIKLMRDRARQLERDDPYARRFLKLLENNVLGAEGVGLQMKITEPAKVGGVWIKQYDTRANQIIEDAWAKWGRREFCTIAGNLTWRDVCRLALRSACRDGAALTRKWPVQNPFGFALEPLEIDHLDMEYNQAMPSAEVRLGKEYDKSGRVVAYHIFSRHPGSDAVATAIVRARQRVSAEQMLDLYTPERFGQGSGSPWIASAGTLLKHLGAYFEAEVIASRAAASKMAFLERTNAVEYQGAVDSAGNRAMEISPGSIEELPPGMTMKPFDPTHPNSQFGGFVKAALRGISAGLGVSYVSLANDLEGVNYSSIRAGLLDEREEWKSIQRWFIDHFIQPVFEAWLQSALAFGAIPLPASKFDKFNAPEWKPRRWDWVDPLKDQQANVLAVEKGFKSRRAIIAEAGGDVEDTFADIAADEKLEETYGLDFAPDSGEQANAQQAKPDAPDNVDKEEK